MKKVVDKGVLFGYNNSCALKKAQSKLSQFGRGLFWRSTQEAEEAPLLRV